MTDHTQRDIDEPPDGAAWCAHPGGCAHAAQPLRSTWCPIHDQQAYANFRMDLFHAPTIANSLPPATSPSTRASWTPSPETEQPCSPNDQPANETPDSATTTTDASADSTGPDSVSATRLTQLWTRALDRIAQQAR